MNYTLLALKGRRIDVRQSLGVGLEPVALFYHPIPQPQQRHSVFDLVSLDGLQSLDNYVQLISSQADFCCKSHGLKENSKTTADETRRRIQYTPLAATCKPAHPSYASSLHPETGEDKSPAADRV